MVEQGYMKIIKEFSTELNMTRRVMGLRLQLNAVFDGRTITITYSIESIKIW